MTEVFDRPGNVELQKAMKQLVKFLAKYGTGVAKQDRARWAIGYGVNRDTAGKYWRQLIDAGAITEPNSDGRYKKTPYFNELLELGEEQLEEQCSELSEEYIETTEKLSDVIDKRIIKEKMRSGPCAHECQFPRKTDCRQCGKFQYLKHKEFLEE